MAGNSSDGAGGAGPIMGFVRAAIGTGLAVAARRLATCVAVRLRPLYPRRDAT